MGTTIRTNQHGTLTLRVAWNGMRSWESTGLADTPANRAKVEKIARAIRLEMRAHLFDRLRYLHYFPEGSKAARFRAELNLNTDRAGLPLPTLRDYATTVWLPRQQVPLVRFSQARDVRAHLRRYLYPHLGDVRIDQIGARHIEDLRRYWLDTGLSLKTVKNVVGGTLRAILRDARTIDYLFDRDPFAGLRWPRLPLKQADPFSEVERAAILVHFRTRWPAYLPYIAALFLAGLRPSEAAARVWSDFDPVAGTLAIYSSRVLKRTGATKTSGSVRTIRLVPELAEILRAGRPADVDPGASIFVGPNGVTIDQGRFAWRQWNPALRALQIRRRRLYDCRHTFISLALSKGVNLKWLAEYCGTSVEMIERRYGRFIQAAGKDELDKLHD